jgi:hypothetical protein
VHRSGDKDKHRSSRHHNDKGQVIWGGPIFSVSLR